MNKMDRSILAIAVNSKKTPDHIVTPTSVQREETFLIHMDFKCKNYSDKLSGLNSIFHKEFYQIDHINYWETFQSLLCCSDSYFSVVCCNAYGKATQNSDVMCHAQNCTNLTGELLKISQNEESLPPLKKTNSQYCKHGVCFPFRLFTPLNSVCMRVGVCVCMQHGVRTQSGMNQNGYRKNHTDFLVI